MIVVSVHTFDNAVAGNNNGAYGIQFYVIAEAIVFAQAESMQQEGGSQTSQSWCKVFKDGVIVKQYINGTEYTG